MKTLTKIAAGIAQASMTIGGLIAFLTTPSLAQKKRQKIWQPLLNHHYAHRGFYDNKWDIPENSLLAFQKAVEHGYGIELDVHLTKDEELIVLHDDDCFRMCHDERAISAMTGEEIRSLHLIGTDQTIPSLKEVLDLVKGQVPLLIELKEPGSRYAILCEKVNALLKDYDGAYMIESFNPLILQWYKKHRPDVIRGQLSCDFFKEKPHCDLVLFSVTFLLTNFLSRPDFISYKYTDYRKPFVFLNCRFFKAKLALWTVNSPDAYATVKKDASFIIFEDFEPA